MDRCVMVNVEFQPISFDSSTTESLPLEILLGNKGINNSIIHARCRDDACSQIRNALQVLDLQCLFEKIKKWEG